MAQQRLRALVIPLVAFLGTGCLWSLAAKEPAQTPENTLSVKLAEPVKPQSFSRPVKFFVKNAIDRSGDPQPILVMRGRGGVFLDREPKEIVREALQDSLKAAGVLAADEASADYVLTVYVFHFGLDEGSGMEFYSKVDLNVVVKNPRTGKSQEVTALGTSIEKFAVRKKNFMARVQANLDESLGNALRNFLRGTKLRDAVEALAGASPQG